MFFLASKLLGWLCYPLSLFFIALLLFVLLRRRRPVLAGWCLGLGALLLYFCSTGWGANLLLRPLERPYLHPSLPARADVILVLGGSLDLMGSTAEHPEYGPAADRFIYSLRLARRYPRATIIYAGGTANLLDKSKTEASILKRAAERLGVAGKRIKVDNKSRNTRENALQAKRILKHIGSSSVVVITSAFHMRRALGCLHKVGIKAIPYAVDVRSHWGESPISGWVPQARQLVDSTAALREYVGLVAYKLKGYI